MNDETGINQSDILAEDYFSDEVRWQSWLDVEAALALSQSEIGMIPEDAGPEIARHATLEAIGIDKLRVEIKRTMAPVFALAECMASASGTAGAYVHWGATTQNVMETGRLLVLRRVQARLHKGLSQVLWRLSTLAKKHAGLVMVGRTNRQNALPITFGFKIAGWIDEMIRVVDQLKEIEPRLFQLRFGGAIGGFHSFGPDGPRLAEILAKRLNLRPSLVPNRTSVDPLIEYILKLSMIGVAATRISEELYLLMTEEIGEVAEIYSDGVIGSSTMPQKVNPKHIVELSSISMQLRAKAASALAIPSPSHEGDALTNGQLSQLMTETCPLAIRVLDQLEKTLELIEPNKARMRQNYSRSREMMATEGLMMRLATTIGRGRAHDIVHAKVAQANSNGTSLLALLQGCDDVVGALGAAAIEQALCFDDNIGQCENIARASARAGFRKPH